MENKSFRKIFIGIILPAIVAILLFFLSVWLIIIPIVEKNMMDAKKEMIGELTNTAWSLVDEYYRDYQDSVYSLREAKNLAARKVELMHYGPENKDYFWITDTSPSMIMHPYRKDLNGKDLSDYKDPNGMKLFVEAAAIVDSAGEGYLNYYWQLRDDTTKIVKKISFVKGFPEWGWIIGTGIYIEDVREDIAALKNRIARISLVITLIIAILLFYIIKQSLKIENKRSTAETCLKESKEKYKSLVEASTESVLMLSNNNVIYVNQTFCSLSGYASNDVVGMRYEDLFSTTWEDMLRQLDEPGQSVSTQAQLKLSTGKLREVIVYLNKTYAVNETRVIVIIKEIGAQQRIEKARQQLSNDLEASLLMMNQPIAAYVEPIISCALDSSIAEVSSIMKRKRKGFVFVKQDDDIIGFVSYSDIVKRAVATGMSDQKPISGIISAPVVSVNQDALLSEVILNFKKHNLSHLLVLGSTSNPIGVISKTVLARVQSNSISVLLDEIDLCETRDELKTKFLETPVIVEALLAGGVYPYNITRLISAIIDGLTKRAIVLAFEELGKPPCKFAFVTMGSEARREQTLLTDQDNAIIYDDAFKEDESVKKYFVELGKTVNQSLDYAGIHLCKGDMMAGNPEWCQPLDKWKFYFTKWINQSDPQSILDASIFFDIRFVYGENAYCAELQRYILEEVKFKAVFFQHMAQGIIDIKLPSVGNKTSVDLKKLLMPVTGFARIYSLKLIDYEANTNMRLKKAASAELITDAARLDLQKVYDFLMTLRLKQQVQLLMDGDNPENVINTEHMTEFDFNSLKKAASIVADYQTQLKSDFKGML
jgi:PAS domain S-box-containing protein